MAFCLLALLPAVVLMADEPSPSGPAEAEFFERHVRPVLAKHCWKCHGENNEESGLRLDSRDALLAGGDRGPAVVSGEPDQSRLIAAIRHEGELKMPPSGRLDPDEIAALSEWVKAGLPWPEWKKPNTDSGHWSLQPVRRPELPMVLAKDWPRRAVDRFILAKLESQGLSPAPPADKRTLLRRVTFDLTGLPPTPAEIDAFLADPSPDAYEKVVDRLLASPHYGERWARHWLDLVRFAETTGHEYDFDIPYVWRYRDYVIRAFNEDLPYTQFALEHIAGDLLKSPRRDRLTGRNESILATAFWWFGQQKSAPVDLRAEECDRIDDQIDVFSKTFLGLSIACARCHDHKFDPATIEDYYALAGYLKSSRRQEVRVDPAESARQLRETVIETKAEVLAGVRERLSADPESPGARQRTWLTPLTLAAAGVWLLCGVLWIRWKRWSRGAVGLFCLATLLLAAGAVWAVGEAPNHQTSLRNDDPLKPFLARSGEDFVRGFPGLARATSVFEFSRQREAVVDQLEAIVEAGEDRGSDVVFEDFSGDSYRGWSVTGEAFGDGPTRAGEFLLQSSPDRPIERFLPPGVAHSGRESGKLRGALRSEDFTVSSAYIHYRMLRRAPAKVPPQQIFDTGGRAGQVHLIVDGLSKNLIFSDEATINIDEGEKFVWYQQEVEEAWMGRRAYIEITDEDDGFIAVDRIVFSNEPLPPPDVPGRLLIDLLDTPAVHTAQGLAVAIEDALAQTVEFWLAGGLAESPDAADHVMLLNWLWERGLAEQLSGDSTTKQRLADQREEIEAREANLKPPEIALVTADGTPHNEYLLPRGDHRQPGPEVPRGWPKFLGGGTASENQGSGRLELARWLTDAGNPLFARVMVNRIWQRHFGAGLVRTVDDFGVMGAPPTHPELLDWLADEFRRQGFSLKSLHRELVLSSTYRMASELGDAETESADPGNRLLHRMPLRRLDAEAIRDAILAISGRLDRRMHGRGIPPYLTPYMDGRGRPDASGPVDGAGRRSLYITVRRNFLTPMLTVFGFPQPDESKGRRAPMNVPAQALTMMNSAFVIEQSRLWSERILNEPMSSDESRVHRLYEMAYGRPPTAEEIESARRFLEESRSGSDTMNSREGWRDLCHVLLNGPEFLYLR